MANEIAGRPTIVWGDAVKTATGGKFDGYMAVKTSMSFKPYMPDCLSQLGLGAWTLEAWVKVDNDSYTGNQAAIFMADMRSDNSARFTLYLQKDQHSLPWGDVKGLVLSCMGGHAPATVPFPTDGTWHHVAVVFDGAEFRCYQDGVMVNHLTADAPQWRVGDHLSFASQDANNDSRFTGGYDEIRITRQVRYTADFTPPAKPGVTHALTKLLDPHLPYRRIVLTEDGTEGSGKIIDMFGHSVVKNGAPAYTLKNKKVGNSSIEYPKANPSSLEFTADDLMMRHADFCIEGWFYPTELTNEWYSLIDTRMDGKNGFFVAFRGADKIIRCWDSGADRHNLDHQTRIVLNQWHHIAAVRANGRFRVYLNGVPSDDSTSNIGDLTSNRIIFGHSYESVGQANFIGFVDDLRVSIGHAIHGAAFNPDTNPYVRSMPFPGADPHEANIVSLIRGTGKFPDRDEAGLAWTPQSSNMGWVNTGSRKWDRLSAVEFLNAEGRQMLAPDGAFKFDQGDFSIEFWMYPYELAQYQMILNTASGADNTNGGIWILFQDGRIRFEVGGANHMGGQINPHAWTHICLERVGPTLFCYTNGRKIDPAGFGTTANLNWTKAGIAQGNTKYSGLIVNFRAYKGINRYNGEDFVPDWAAPTLPNKVAYPGYGMTGKPVVTGVYTFEHGAGDIVGQTNIVATEKNSGTKSLQTTATGTSLYIPGAKRLLGEGPFTEEFFVKLPAAPASVACFLAANNGVRDDGTLTIFLQDGHLRISTPGDSAITATEAFPIGRWVHVAFTYDGTTYRGYQDGKLVSQTVNHAPVIKDTQNIGISNNAGYDPARYGFDGFIDDIRITKGIALYTADIITPPTMPYPDPETASKYRPAVVLPTAITAAHMHFEE